MIKPIFNRIIRPVSKPVSKIRTNFLERKIKNIDNLIKQRQTMNLKTIPEIKYKERLEKKLNSFSKPEQR